MGAQAPKKIRTSEYKKGLRQHNYDEAGHEIHPVRKDGVMLWGCDVEQAYVKHHKTVLKPRRSGK